MAGGFGIDSGHCLWYIWCSGSGTVDEIDQWLLDQLGSQVGLRVSIPEYRLVEGLGLICLMCSELCDRLALIDGWRAPLGTCDSCGTFRTVYIATRRIP